MAEYKDTDKILSVDTLIGYIKNLKGYVEEELGSKLVPIEQGWAASLDKDGVNLGAFLIFDRVRLCIRPYYFDDYEEGAVGTKHHHGVTLAYENLGVEQRVDVFNKQAKKFYDDAKVKGLKNIPLYEIKDLKPFKMKNASKST